VIRPARPQDGEAVRQPVLAGMLLEGKDDGYVSR
jgi:hypothetical protein